MDHSARLLDRRPRLKYPAFAFAIYQLPLFDQIGFGRSQLHGSAHSMMLTVQQTNRQPPWPLTSHPITSDSRGRGVLEPRYGVRAQCAVSFSNKRIPASYGRFACNHSKPSTHRRRRHARTKTSAMGISSEYSHTEIFSSVVSVTSSSQLTR